MNDIKDFEKYVKLNMRRAYASAFAILGSHDDAMEISQQAFINAYKSFHLFDKSKNFYTWYYKILKNLCLNLIRDSKRKKNVSILYAVQKEVESPENTFIKNEQIEAVNIALNKLEPEEREILILKEFENYSYKELSEILNIPQGTVMSRLYYSRKKLAKLISEELK